MEQIDWSKAPKGATHYHAGLCYPWLRVRQQSCHPQYYQDGLGWVNYSIKSAGMKHVNDAIPRQQCTVPTWDGHGLPPKGTVCEYSIGEPNWYPCEIRYVLDNDPHPDADGWVAVIWCPHLKKEQVAKAHFQFRTLRTPEQIAAEEREKAISEMVALYNTGRTAADGFAAVYDAGYRLVEGGAQ